MLILGHPGSGKTTLMKWIALQCLKPENKEFFSQFTPVFISLKYLGGDPDNTFRKKSIGNLIVDFFEKENISVDLFIGNQMKDNRLLFLLDGLDEIGDEKIRREVIDWIQKQYIYQNSLIVVMKDDRYENIRELAVNPLLLNIIAIVHRTRAILPRDRHKLYEECLKVMIELWNLANRKIDINFSLKKSL
ncbi:MAG: NACHT domain-containing protein [Candidatus Aminicenantes bacterium]|nr:MAG: NACHT domain-containing protein [Candidatus Aminicenantes bacterium]